MREPARERENRKQRLRALAQALCVKPHGHMELWLSGSAREGWWLSGVEGGDVKLPRTRGCVTVWDALEAAEAWLAPELDREEP